MMYELIILGGGPAGYIAAERAGHAGLKVALVEERSLGGVCLNEGCIPTKTLLYSAKVYDGAAHGGKYGVTAQGAALDHAAVVKRKDKVVKTLVSGVKSAVKAAGADVFEARGVVAGRDADGFRVKAGETEIVGKRLLIATGSVPTVPPIPGLKEALASGFAVTSRELLSITQPPKSLCVVGGGVIGLEFVSYFATIGAKVTVVEMLDHLAGDNDRELVSLLQAELEKRGVSFELSAKVTKINSGSVEFERGGETKTVQADLALLAIGRRPNTQGLGLENIGLATDRGAVAVDSHMRAGAPGVWAAGDVTGFSMLAHTAYREAEVAVGDMLGAPDFMRYEAIPGVLYTSPELASVGETAESAARKGLPHKVVKLPMRFSGRYLAENEGGFGQMKLVVHTATRQVLGAQMLGNYASEIIISVGSWIDMGLTVDQIKRFVFPHPTVGEILREAVFQYE